MLRSRRNRSTFACLVVTLATCIVACSDNQEPEQADELYARVTAQPFRTWARPEHYSKRTASFTAHADAVDIFMNTTLSEAVNTGRPPPWPDGSLIVKEGFTGDDRKLVAIMEKRAGAWFFAEYNDSGEALFSGTPSVCTDCHDNRAAYSDWLYSVEPRR